jgi:hypothetical protein
MRKRIYGVKELCLFGIFISLAAFIISQTTSVYKSGSPPNTITVFISYSDAIFFTASAATIASICSPHIVKMFIFHLSAFHSVICLELFLNVFCHFSTLMVLSEFYQLMFIYHNYILQYLSF